MLKNTTHFNKRGISPIIATVLLLALSISLGAIVLTFSQKTTTDLTGSAETAISKEIQCSFDMSVKLMQVNRQDFICYNRTGSSNLELIVENDGTQSVYGVQVMALDSGNIPFTSNMLTGITSHNRTKYNVSLGASFVFPPIKVLVSPIISSSGSTIDVCSNNRIDTEDVCKCGTDGCV